MAEDSIFILLKKESTYFFCGKNQILIILGPVDCKDSFITSQLCYFNP